MSLADYIKNKMPYWPNWINLTLLYCNIFGKYAYGMTYVKALKDKQSKSPEERLLEMINYAIENVEYYRKRYNGIKIHTIEEFERTIKVIDKKEVMNHWKEFLCDNIDMTKCVTGTTGGTSGKPMKLVTPKNRYIRTFLSWHTDLKQFGWNYDAMAVIRNHKLDSNKDYMINPVMKQFIFDAFRMDEKYAYEVWSIMKRHRVRFIHAYPSGAYQFLKYCYKQGLDTSFIKVCSLSSEEITDYQRHFIEETLHIALQYSYGHSEKLIRAKNCPYSPLYHIEEDYGYCELMDEQNNVIIEKGKPGEIVGTTLNNKFFPLIRYKTGDYTSYATNACKCHLNNRFFYKIEGHHDISILYRSDGGYTTTTALNLHGNVYEHIDGLQYIQDKIGEVTVLIIKNEKFTQIDRNYLQQHFENGMGKGSKVELKFVDKLIFQPNGKFLLLISNVKKMESFN